MQIICGIAITFAISGISQIYKLELKLFNCHCSTSFQIFEECFGESVPEEIILSSYFEGKILKEMPSGSKSYERGKNKETV